MYLEFLILSCTNEVYKKLASFSFLSSMVEVLKLPVNYFPGIDSIFKSGKSFFKFL